MELTKEQSEKPCKIFIAYETARAQEKNTYYPLAALDRLREEWRDLIIRVYELAQIDAEKEKP